VITVCSLPCIYDAATSVDADTYGCLTPAMPNTVKKVNLGVKVEQVTIGSATSDGGATTPANRMFDGDSKNWYSTATDACFV
jgi:hypothetical protein